MMNQKMALMGKRIQFLSMKFLKWSVTKAKINMSKVINTTEVILTLELTNGEIKTTVMQLSAIERKIKTLIKRKLLKYRRENLSAELPVFETGTEELIHFSDVKTVVIQGPISEAYINQELLGVDADVDVY